MTFLWLVVRIQKIKTNHLLITGHRRYTQKMPLLLLLVFHRFFLLDFGISMVEEEKNGKTM